MDIVEMVTTCAVVAVVLLIPASVVLGVRNNRQREMRIRDWAREKGYAILRIEHQGRIFMDLAPLWFLRGPHEYRVQIQDDQGGQTTVTIFIKSVSGPLDVRWG
jgi:hypothetical protein